MSPAIITFTNHPDLHILASASDGSFRSGRLTPGEYRLHVEAEGYNAGDCTATINAPAAPAATPGAAGGTSAPATGTTGAGTTPAAPAAASVDADATVTCELRPQPRRGSIAGRVLSSQGGAGVSGATVVVTPAQGFRVAQGQSAPTERTAMTDGNGRFDLGDMLVGPYAVSVQASERHMAATPVNVNVEARMPANVDITVTRRPARPSVTLMGNVLLLARQVHFQVNSADILPDSNTLLEEIADVLHRNSSITAVEIQGHTDNSGQPDRNMTLSQQRAEAVRDRLVALGIRMDMLSARGFGQTRPIRPNLTAVGRAMNRRVEIHVSRGASSGATGGGATGGAARPATGGATGGAARPATGAATGGAARPATGGAAGGAPRP